MCSLCFRVISIKQGHYLKKCTAWKATAIFETQVQTIYKNIQPTQVEK